MQFDKFLSVNDKNCVDRPTLVEVEVAEFRKQKKYTLRWPSTTHVVKVLTDAILSSQSRGFETCRVIVPAKTFNKGVRRTPICNMQFISSTFYKRLL